MSEPARLVIESASRWLEALAVLLMCGLILGESVRWVVQALRRQRGAYTAYRLGVGKSLLLGLELLVAADIISTVALGTTLANMLVLGCLVILRTFLSWTLSLEVEGRWPWQTRGASAASESTPTTE